MEFGSVHSATSFVSESKTSSSTDTSGRSLSSIPSLPGSLGQVQLASCSTLHSMSAHSHLGVVAEHEPASAAELASHNEPLIVMSTRKLQTERRKVGFVPRALSWLCWLVVLTCSCRTGGAMQVPRRLSISFRAAFMDEPHRRAALLVRNSRRDFMELADSIPIILAGHFLVIVASIIAYCLETVEDLELVSSFRTWCVSHAEYDTVCLSLSTSSHRLCCVPG